MAYLDKATYICDLMKIISLSAHQLSSQFEPNINMASNTNQSNGRDPATVWDSDLTFMTIAFAASKRSNDPVTQVGAVIVNEHSRIISTGCNNMPSGCEERSWKKPEKRLYVLCAEPDAILNNNVRNCKIYVTMHPCNQCAKLIINSGIKEVIYYSDKKYERTETVASKAMLEDAGIPTRQYTAKNPIIMINMEEINETD